VPVVERLRRPLQGPLLWAAAVTAAAVVLRVRDPHVAGSYGLCPWNLLTGGYCPGCGGLRAVHDLTHADLAGAASSNLLVVALLPAAVLGWAGWTRARWRGERFALPLSGWAGAAVLTVAVAAFTVLRNLTTGSWLAP
jgi:Protein of unknown function (DUF2752)